MTSTKSGEDKQNNLPASLLYYPNLVAATFVHPAFPGTPRKEAASSHATHEAASWDVLRRCGVLSCLPSSPPVADESEDTHAHEPGESGGFGDSRGLSRKSRFV